VSQLYSKNRCQNVIAFVKNKQFGNHSHVIGVCICCKTLTDKIFSYIFLTCCGMFLYHILVTAGVHVCLYAMYVVSKCLQAENVSLIVAGNHILTLVIMLVLLNYNT